MRTSNDVELVERMRGGDETAIEDLASAYRARIVQLARRYLKSHEDAEEVAQDVLLKVVRNIDAFRGDAALSSWIYRITFNAAMTRRRYHTRHGVEAAEQSIRIRPASDAERVADWSSLADDRLMRDQVRRKVASAIRRLPEMYRGPILLRDVHGMTPQEASEALRLKPPTFKSRLHRGRILLRKELREFEGDLALHGTDERSSRTRRRRTDEHVH